MKALLIIFSVLLILLLSRLWIGTSSYPERWRTQERTAIQQAANEKKQKEVNKIQTELDDAKSGSDAIEERARSELGMIKEGETFFKVILQPTPVETKKPKRVKQTDKQKSQDSGDAISLNPAETD